MERLKFGPEEEDEFFATRDRVLDEFRESVQTTAVPGEDPVRVHDAQVLLDWRFMYSTGELTRYTVGDLKEFLLQWYPRKIMAEPDAAPAVCRSIGAFLEFLHVTGRLDGGAKSVTRLISTAQDCVPELQRALADSGGFGLAKTLMSADFGSGALTDLPPDLDSLQALLDQRMAEFNALPFEQRKALTDGALGDVAVQAPDIDEPTEVGELIVPPSEQRVDSSAATAPSVARYAALREFLGERGRPLTATGNPKVADLVPLVDLLGAREEPQFVPNARSADDLPQLQLLLDIAITAGVVRRYRGRLTPVKASARRLAVHQVAAYLDAALDIGPLWHLGRRAYLYDSTNEFLDAGIPPMLVSLLSGPLTVAEMVDWAEAAIEEFGRMGGRPWAPRFRRTRRQIEDILWVLSFIGVAGKCDADGVVQPGPIDGDLADDDVIVLTPVGAHLVIQRSEGFGYRLRVAPDLANADADQLLDILVASDPAELDGLLAQWRPELLPAERGALVAERAARSTAAIERTISFAVLTALGPDAVEPVVRQLLDTPVSGYAARFLVEHHLAEPFELGKLLDVSPMVDMLSLVVHDPEVFDRVIADLPQGGDMGALIDEMWRVPLSEAGDVLAALGRQLKDKKLAKAARKAVIQHRSRMKGL